MPREVIRFVLMWKGVPEGWLNGVVSLCKCCKTAVSVDGELSSLFSVKVGVHQGSTQSPLLFVIVIDVLTEYLKDAPRLHLPLFFLSVFLFIN